MRNRWLGRGVLVGKGRFLALDTVQSVQCLDSRRVNCGVNRLVVWIMPVCSGTLACMVRSILRYALFYGGPLAAFAVLLQWIEYRYVALSMPGEIYIAVIATIFIGLGIWLGIRLTQTDRSPSFARNHKAIAALKLTPRECEILEHLASGASNKEIARTLGVSPNTVKTHIASVTMKLNVNGRGRAVEAARELALIP